MTTKPSKPLERWLTCPLMCALTLHLNILPIHELAMADPPTCPPANPIPSEVAKLIETQQAIHEAVFADEYDMCDDNALTLDHEIMEAPSIVTGVNAKEEAFTQNISLVSRFSEWDGVDGLTTEQINDLNSAQAAFSLIMGDLDGPEGLRRIGAIACSLDVVGVRLSLLMPISDFGAIALPSNVSCAHLDAQYELCVANAVATQNQCMDNAKGDFDECIGNSVLTAGGSLLACLLAAAAPPAVFLCLTGIIVAVTVAVTCLNSYISDAEQCFRDLCYALNQCCREATFRQTGQLPADEPEC